MQHITEHDRLKTVADCDAILNWTVRMEAAFADLKKAADDYLREFPAKADKRPTP